MSCVKCGGNLPEGAKFCPWCGKNQTAQPKRKALKRANGTGTVYKLSGRRSRPWVAAKNKVVIGYYAKKSDALEALNKLTGQEISDRYNLTFDEVFKEWSAEHYPTITAAGIQSYDGAYKVFEPLHNKQFRTLRTADFQAVIDSRQGKSHSTVSKYKQLITQMSKWAIREELITTNFASFVRLPENVKKEKEIFTDSEIAKLEADGSEAAKIVLMMIYTGMRIGELFDLTVNDWHETYVVGGEKTEAGRNRTIPIMKKGRPLFAYFAECATGEQLLSGYIGQHNAPHFRQREYYALLKRLGIERKTPHAARHTFASIARKNGVPPEVLQKVLGHADYSTTANIYVHTDVEELIGAIEKCL